MRTVSRKLDRIAYVKNGFSVCRDKLSTYDQTQGAFESYENETMTFDFDFIFLFRSFLSASDFVVGRIFRFFENGNSQLMNK